MNCSEPLIKCVDFRNLASERLNAGDENIEEWTKVAEKLVESFKEIGFAYIENHGIPEETIAKAHRLGHSFFKLSDEKKAKYSKEVASKQGYVEANREKLNKDGSLEEIRESYDVFSPNGTFPSEIEGIGTAVTDLLKQGEHLAFKLLRCLEIGLDLEAGTLMNAHRDPFSEENSSLLRILHYPPIPDDVPEGAIRCGEHTDYGTFTLLFQDDMGGLEVKARKGDWVKADPIPGAILVNVGDLLQMWTADRLVATVHRVLIPKEEILRRSSRRSIVLFFHPEDEVLVQPLDGSSAYSPIKAGEHLLKRYQSLKMFGGLPTKRCIASI